MQFHAKWANGLMGYWANGKPVDCRFMLVEELYIIPCLHYQCPEFFVILESEYSIIFYFVGSELCLYV